MLECAKRYGLQQYIFSDISCNDFNVYQERKRVIKRVIKETEIYQWKATCLIYKSLDVYAEMASFRVHPWWMFARDMPHLFWKISGVVSLLMGGQPKGLKRNAEKSKCGLCVSNDSDNTEHVLFRCDALNNARTPAWKEFNNSLLPAMCSDMQTLSDGEKTKWLLSGYGENYIPEWSMVYGATVFFIYNLYTTRARQYDELGNIV